MTKREIATRHAYSYQRWSTPEQRHGDSQRRQTEAFERFCKFNNLIPDKSYTDQMSGFGGKNRKKGKLAAFIESNKKGLIPSDSVLVVENVDRLSRLPLDEAMDIAREILSAGVSIGLVSNGHIYDKKSLNDVGTYITLAIEFHRGHSESKTKSIRIGAAWAEKKRLAQQHGTLSTRKVPAWFERDEDGKTRLVDGKPIANKKKRKLINEIFASVYGGASIATVCNRLNEKRIPPLGRAKYWRGVDLYELLTNRRLLGEVQQTTLGKKYGQPIKDYYPAVVTEELFDNVQSALRKRRTTLRGRHNPKRKVNLFTGLIFSHLFKKDVNADWEGFDPLHINTKERHSSLVPETAKNKTGGYCSFPYDAIEAAFRFAWAKYLPLEQLSPRRHRESIARLQTMKAAWEAAEDRAQQIEKDYSERPIPRLLNLLRNADHEVEILKQQYEKAREDIDDKPKERAKAIKELFESMDSLEGLKLRDHREKLSGLIAESVKLIELRITEFSRYSKQAYFTILLREPHDDVKSYHNSKPLFIPLIIRSQRNEIIIWNKMESDKGIGGYLIKRGDLKNAENIPPHLSSLEFLIED